MKRSFLVSLPAAAWVALLPAAIAAQQIDVSEVLRPQSRPQTVSIPAVTGGGGSTGAEAAEATQEDASAAEEDTPQPPPARFFPLRAVGAVPQEDGSVLMQGLSATQDFLWFLPEGEMPTELTLTSQTSVYALPERSRLSVSLNGTEILSGPAQSISGQTAQSIELPEGLARPGRNELRISVQHTHRLSCTAETAYELWTRVQPDESGAATTANSAGDADGAVLLARIAAQDRLPFSYADGSRQLRTADHRILSAMGRLVEGLPLDPVAAPLAASVPEPVRVVFAAPISTEVAVRARADGGTDFLIADGASDAAIGRALGMADFGRDDATYLLSPGEAVSLGAMGFRSAQISGRQWESIVEFRLPEFWMAASTAKAILRIDYAHVAELPEGSQIQLEVNGVPAWRLPLDFRQARIRRGVPIYLDARHLSAGRNQLRFISQVAAEDEDQACAPLGEALLVEVSADSTLTVPPSPEMFLPTLSRALERIGPAEIDVHQAALQEAGGLAPRIAALFPPAEIDAADREPLQLRALGEVADLSERDRLVHRIVAQTDLAAPTPVSQETESYAFAISEAEAAPSFDNILQLSRSGRLEGVWLRARSLVLGEPAPELAAWSGDAEPVAALYLPQDSSGPVLIQSPGIRPEFVSVALSRARRTDPPLHGQVAFLLQNGEWAVWKDPTTVPVLAEAVTGRNLFGVLSNYSGRYPHFFVGAMLASAVVLAGLLTLIMGGLRRRK